MVSVTALWVPILAASGLVFFVSSIIHMVLKYHNSDFAAVPNEDGVQAALREFILPPGDYVIPHACDAKERESEEFKAKAQQGPVVFMTVFPEDAFNMKSSLIQWFLYCILISVFAAYIAGHALAPGADYLSVFRFAGTVAFAGYGLALLQNSIWMKKNWTATGKSVFDSLIYGLVTAGAMGWLWPS